MTPGRVCCGGLLPKKSAERRSLFLCRATPTHTTCVFDTGGVPPPAWGGAPPAPPVCPPAKFVVWPLPHRGSKEGEDPPCRKKRGAQKKGKSCVQAAGGPLKPQNLRGSPQIFPPPKVCSKKGALFPYPRLTPSPRFPRILYVPSPNYVNSENPGSPPIPNGGKKKAPQGKRESPFARKQKESKRGPNTRPKRRPCVAPESRVFPPNSGWGRKP